MWVSLIIFFYRCVMPFIFFVCILQYFFSFSFCDDIQLTLIISRETYTQPKRRKTKKSWYIRKMFKFICPIFIWQKDLFHYIFFTLFFTWTIIDLLDYFYYKRRFKYNSIHIYHLRRSVKKYQLLLLSDFFLYSKDYLILIYNIICNNKYSLK